MNRDYNHSGAGQTVSSVDYHNVCKHLINKFIVIENGTMRPVDYSFEAVNEFVHHPDVQFEDLQNCCLGMASVLNKKEKP